MNVHSCIPRDMMPQIDERHLGELVHWLDQQGVRAIHDVVSPKTLKTHQMIDKEKVLRMPPEVLDKPCLISIDLFILDGNHRWMAHHYRRHAEMKVITLDRPFDESVELLELFPKAYTYGDGGYHPISY